MENTVILETIESIANILLPILGLIVAVLAAQWNRRKDKLTVIEQSFAELQSFNELALSDKKSLEAAILSANPDDEFNEEKARIVYVHFLRINRMFRSWMYYQYKILNETQAREIILGHARTLKSISESKLRKMMQRGYPDEFTNYLVEIVNTLPCADTILYDAPNGQSRH